MNILKKIKDGKRKEKNGKLKLLKKKRIPWFFHFHDDTDIFIHDIFLKWFSIFIIKFHLVI